MAEWEGVRGVLQKEVKVEGERERVVDYQESVYVYEKKIKRVCYG